MKLAVISLAVLVCQSLAVDDASAADKNKESFVPVAKENVQQNALEVNDIRYKLRNIEISKAEILKQVTATAEEWPDRASLLHPNFWTYCIHLGAQVFAGVLVLLPMNSPRRTGAIVLLVLLVLAVVCWPISLMSGEAIWAMQPGAADWWLMCAKSVIVNICPTVPMLLCLIKRPGQSACHWSGIWTYGVLWANVAWTLCFLPLAFNAVSVTNAVCGVSLCVSLIVHNVALCRKGVTLFEVKKDIVYGYGTSLSWLVCYTVWNALFVIELAPGLTLQDICFWAMMIFFYYWSEGASGIENYFAMARPISLSAYIATSDWPGLLDFFRKAEPMGLDMTRHAYFLFLAVFNAVFSLYVMYWAFCLLLECGGADKYFKTTFKTQKLDSGAADDDDEEMDDLDYGEVEDAEDEEEDGGFLGWFR